MRSPLPKSNTEGSSIIHSRSGRGTASRFQEDLPEAEHTLDTAKTHDPGILCDSPYHDLHEHEPKVNTLGKASVQAPSAPRRRGFPNTADMPFKSAPMANLSSPSAPIQLSKPATQPSMEPLDITFPVPPQAVPPALTATGWTPRPAPMQPPKPPQTEALAETVEELRKHDRRGRKCEICGRPRDRDQSKRQWEYFIWFLLAFGIVMGSTGAWLLVGHFTKLAGDGHGSR
ncbi:hypothetical protein MKZ38_006911 [Zalerion maritima]|uniref:Uncharacterized protein n=1 Tax=Zalerion maritima TaxID=339359 RepID=A0AAD5RVX7_9PEZI|nr:hypothetical protein MKZ38_006911 [Zalerion maritima]